MTINELTFEGPPNTMDATVELGSRYIEGRPFPLHRPSVGGSCPPSHGRHLHGVGTTEIPKQQLEVWTGVVHAWHQ